MIVDRVQDLVKCPVCGTRQELRAVKHSNGELGAYGLCPRCDAPGVHVLDKEAEGK